MFVVFLFCVFSRVVAEDSNSNDSIAECPVKTIYPESALTSVGFTPNRNEDIWLKPGRDFSKIVFRVWKDRIYDFHGTLQDTTHLQFTRELLNLDESSINKWIHIRFQMTLRERHGIDTFVMRAFANGRSIHKDTGLWWRTVDVKKIEILVEGEAEVAIDCRPISVQKELFEHAALKSDPFRYAFWGICAMLVILSISAAIAILKYCKVKVRKQTLAICEKENNDMSLRQFSCGENRYESYDMDEHVYDEPEVFKDSKYLSGEYESEYINNVDIGNELPLSVPKLTEESVYVQMDLFKK